MKIKSTIVLMGIGILLVAIPILANNQPGSDRIGDVSYNILSYPPDPSVKDRYPFMEESGWEAPVNQPPSFSSPNQYKSIATEDAKIGEGKRTSDSTIIFKAMVSDPDNDDQAKLQVQIKEEGQGWQPIIESGFVDSGNEAVVIRPGLNEAKYSWRARAIDEKGAVSEGDWQEFGTAGNVDFEARFVPKYTQKESPYPSREETRLWAGKIYAYATPGRYWCGQYIDGCGCAITSMVMLGRYYNINEAIDRSDVEPGNINAWLISNEGYVDNIKSERDGGLNWGKAIEYSGFINETTGQIQIMARLSLDLYNASTSVGWQMDEIDNHINLSQPAIAYHAGYHHYFIIDNKTGDDSYTVKDPKWYKTSTLNDAKNGDKDIQDYDGHFDTANLFSYLPEPKPITALLYVYIASPAELLVIDPLGRKLGKDPVAGIVYNEIPNGSYTKEGVIASTDEPSDPSAFPEGKVIYISSLIDGEYDIKVIGTDLGIYALDFLAYDKTTKFTVESFNNVINAGAISDYKVIYPIIPTEPVVIKHVVESHDLVSEIGIARQLNLIDSDGLKNSLFQKLDNAQKQIEKNKNKTAINVLNSFINEVEAQKRKHIDSDFAEILIKDAQKLIENLQSPISSTDREITIIILATALAIAAVGGLFIARRNHFLRKK